MNRILIILVVFGYIPLACAQNNIAEYEYFYRLSFLKDTTQNVTTDDLMVLRLNKDRSLFYSENSYRLDSLLSSDKGSAIRQDILANGSSKYGKRIVSYNILKDFPNGKLDYTDNVGGEHYRYQENLPAFNWKITNETKDILGYKCTKAVSKFRGRTYVAWYTEEIPVNDGPWKFHGLPGLILEVYDLDRHYSFLFVGLSKSEANIMFLPQKYINTSRNNYLKAYKNFIKDPVAYISASSGMKITLSPSASKRRKEKKKRTNYTPMELDY